MNKKAIEGLVLLIVLVVAALGMGIALYSPGSPTGAVSLQQVQCDCFSDADCINNPNGQCCLPTTCDPVGEDDGLCGPCPTTTTTSTTGTTVTSFTTTSTTSTTTSTFVRCSTTTTTSTTTSTTSTSSTGTSTTTTSSTSTTTTTQCINPVSCIIGQINCCSGFECVNNQCVTTTTTSTTSTTVTVTTSTTTSTIILGSIGPQANGACCGDGIINQPEEECDDGNNIDGDGCNADCKREFCGDDITQPVLGEECDGDDVDCDQGFTCNDVCKCEGCGDGGVSGTEECDPGDPGLACPDGSTCPDDCDCPDCGNNAVDPGEVCDGEDDDECPGDCNPACTCPECSNGVLDIGEVCDPAGPSVFCLNGYECNSNCECGECGNGIVEASEECDDGNNIDGDGCEADCTDPFCGNGIFDSPAEQCDDGDLGICAPTFSCNPDCTCICASPGDCDDDSLCTNDDCVDNSCVFDLVVSCPAKACATPFCNPSTGLCEYITNPGCRSGSGGGSGSQSGPVTCCENPQFGNVVYDCECTISDHDFIRVQPNECCYNPESENCNDFCRVIAPASQGVPAGGYFTNLPTGSRPPSVGVQEPAAGVAQEAGSAQTARTFAEPERGSPIVSGATGAFDKNINTQGALIIGIILALALVTGIVIVVARRRG